MDIYHKKAWDTYRKSILRRDSYTCQLCKRFGKMRAASHVHHIYPAEHYPEFGFEPWNLISLCQPCHNKMHDRDTHELSAEGEALKRRTEWKRSHGKTDGLINKDGSIV